MRFLGSAIKEYQNTSNEVVHVIRPATYFKRWHEGKYVWYKTKHGDELFLLCRMSENANVLEFVSSYKNFPKTIDLNDETYRIYYCQK